MKLKENNFENLNLEELKEIYLQFLDEFLILRNKEVDYEGDDTPLSEDEVERYLYLVQEILQPLQIKLDDLGESSWVDENSFSYEM